MKKWSKKPVLKQTVQEMTEKYGISPITASILLRRGITKSREIMYFLENDRRFMHNPFEFSSMEDAVDRILQAQEEGEIVLIFGDRDVDGISSTTILFEQLKSMGIEAMWRLPGGNDGYGLSMEAVDEFYAQNGTLIITVDCGISNNCEIAHAAELGIDVIVFDHHNPPEQLPSPAIIVDPKCPGSQYPFQDISGAAIACKAAAALRFTKSELYKQEICLLAVHREEDGNSIEAIKVRNLVKQEILVQKIQPQTVSFSKTKFLSFLTGQQIFVWNQSQTMPLLKETFGSSVEFNVLDLEKEFSKLVPQFSGKSLEQLKKASKFAKYAENDEPLIETFFNIFVTCMNLTLARQFPQDSMQEEKDLQLAALAALADIMPLKDENRILVRQGIKSINAGKARPGLIELLSKLKLLGSPVTSSKLSWNVVPVLNATGRLGQPELGMKLFLEEDSFKRDALADEIIAMNCQRKELGQKAWEIGQKTAEESIRHFSGKLCVVIDREINRGVSGILAGKLTSTYKVPSMAVTVVDGIAIGSMRSCRGFMLPPFLDKMSDIFINHGGHNLAAGFSFEESRMEEFKKRLEVLCADIQLNDEEDESIEIDAELPPQYLKPEILSVIDQFEPYGEENPELTFLTQGLKIQDGILMGKPDPVHLKLVLDTGETKWPAVFFGEAQRLHRDFDRGDRVSVLYQLQRNVFNGNVTPQMILSEACLTEGGL